MDVSSGPVKETLGATGVQEVVNTENFEFVSCS